MRAGPKRKKKRIRPPAPPRLKVIEQEIGQTQFAPELGPVGGYADGPGGTVHVFPGTDKYTVAHEVGHLFDSQVLSDGDRNYFTRLLHSPAGPWRTGTGQAGGYGSPNEHFADYYAAAATGYDPRPKREGKGVSGGETQAYVRIGPKRLKRFKKALERVQRRQGLQDYNPR